MATKENLREILEGLAELIDCWNDCANDGDRGRDNDALCITIWDDGSGQLGTVWGHVPEMNIQTEFDNVDELTEYLNGWMKLDRENAAQQVVATSRCRRLATLLKFKVICWRPCGLSGRPSPTRKRLNFFR